MRSLNPDQLRTFIEVVERGSFTAAGRELHLTQPAISLQVRELEAYCRVRLIDRCGRRPVPTEAGRVLLVHARRILKANEEALSALRSHGGASGSRVRVGMTMTTLTYLARDVVRRLKRDHPEIDMPITLSSSPGLIEGIRSSNLDIAIVTWPGDEPDIDAEVIYSDTVMGIVPDGGFVPQPVRATAALLSSMPFIVQNVGDVQTVLAQEWFRASGQAPNA